MSRFIKEAFETPGIEQSSLTKQQCITAIEQILVSQNIVELNRVEAIYEEELARFATAGPDGNPVVPVANLIDQLVLISKQLYFKKEENKYIEELHVKKKAEAMLE